MQGNSKMTGAFEEGNTEKWKMIDIRFLPSTWETSACSVTQNLVTKFDNR